MSTNTIAGIYIILNTLLIIIGCLFSFRLGAKTYRDALSVSFLRDTGSELPKPVKSSDTPVQSEKKIDQPVANWDNV